MLQHPGILSVIKVMTLTCLISVGPAPCNGVPNPSRVPSTELPRSCPTPEQIERTLSSVAFLNENDCHQFMCATNPPQSPVSFWYHIISSQPCWYVILKQQNQAGSSSAGSDDAPTPTPSDFHTIEDFKSVLGNSVDIYDNEGNLIGVESLANDTSQGGSSNSGVGRGRSRKPTRPSNVNTDVCCSTREVFYINSTLVDYFGNQQTIAQSEQYGSYQFIRHGLCGSSGDSCPCSCRQIYINIPLVIHPPLPGNTISYQFFKIPGYCSCRVRSSRVRNKN